jgi:RNA processing factor Prp31
MIVQAIGLLDDLDKELNTYAMRVREWFGWHFPEMTKIVSDNIAYAKVVRARARAPPLPACDGSFLQSTAADRHASMAAWAQAEATRHCSLENTCRQSHALLKYRQPSHTAEPDMAAGARVRR